jgi:hypothetical protein
MRRRRGSVRQYVIAHAYLLGEVTDLQAIGAFQRLPLAWRIFGKEPVNAAVDRVFRVLGDWGYQRTRPDQIAVALTEALLRNRSPLLSDPTTEALVRIRDEPGLGPQARRNLYGVHRAIAALGHADPPTPPRRGFAVAEIEGVAASWVAWIERWHATSTLGAKSRNGMRSVTGRRRPPSTTPRSARRPSRGPTPTPATSPATFSSAVYKIAVCPFQIGGAEHGAGQHRPVQVGHLLAELGQHSVGVRLGELRRPRPVADVQLAGGVGGRLVGGFQQLDPQHRAAFRRPGRVEQGRLSRRNRRARW